MSTVLLVDDDEDNCHLLQVWLTAMGHQVHLAASALEALRVLSEHAVPDIAIVDIVMDDINGLDLLHHLRRHEPLTTHLPAILLTARDLDSDRVDAWALEAVLMKKPVTRAALSAAIERALRPAGR